MQQQSMENLTNALGLQVIMGISTYLMQTALKNNTFNLISDLSGFATYVILPTMMIFSLK